MRHRLIAALIVVATIVLLGYTLLQKPKASASPKDLNVISRTRGDEVLTAAIVNNQVRITLKNNHKDTITAFAISFTGTIIKEDFAYSEVHFGIEPGDTLEKDYAISPPVGSEPPPLYLLTVLLRDGRKDGDLKVAQEIKDERLGEKIQILRTLRILEREGQSAKDLQTTKSEVIAALDSDEVETRIALNELAPTSPTDHKLSNDLKNGLHWGREKILRRFEVLERLPPEYREQGFMELKDRSNKLLAKL